MKTINLVQFSLFFISSYLMGQETMNMSINQKTNYSLFVLPRDTTEKETREALPIGGFKNLLDYLEKEIIGNTDTTSKKYSLQLYNVRYRINTRGEVDTAYVGISHNDCFLLHQEIVKLIKDTKWEPALKNGKPVIEETTLAGHIRLPKRIFKKYKCRKGLTLPH